ncbi:hypothetical protein PHMEG_00021363 [Phytophthora megakarya]|uniref:Uncharacterized protein n=1 Tax=Phytophthora megakarya TaxID=4795 RepID=A0A225VLE5_9STRA|nr:hypothetical protein PHMEG_00021363 [Phytophthora megakarya]
MKGLPPLEYKDLDVVVRESCARNRAAQDAERAVAQEQPISEPAAGDDQALSSVASLEAPLSESGTTRVEGEPTRDESAQASVGGADMVAPKPGQDVDVVSLEKKVPPVVKAEPEVQDLTADDSVPESESKKIVRRTVVRVKLEPTSVPGAAELSLATQATSGPTGPESSQADALAKAYCIAGSKFPLDEFFRLKWCTRGLKYQITLLKARQCAAVLQTLFFEAVFQFDNAVPEWFRTHVGNVGLGHIRFVTETIQCLFAVESIEWKKLTMGVFCEVTPRILQGDAGPGTAVHGSETGSPRRFANDRCGSEPSGN